MTRIEGKIKWASVATYLGSAAGLGVLQAVTDAELVAALPDSVEPFVLALLPLVATFLAGYQARHTARPDLEPEPGDHTAGPGRPAFDPDTYDDV